MTFTIVEYLAITITITMFSRRSHPVPKDEDEETSSLLNNGSDQGQVVNNYGSNQSEEGQGETREQRRARSDIIMNFRGVWLIFEWRRETKCKNKQYFLRIFIGNFFT